MVYTGCSLFHTTAMDGGRYQEQIVCVHKDLRPEFYLRHRNGIQRVDYTINGMKSSEVNYDELDVEYDNTYRYSIPIYHKTLRKFPLSVDLSDLHSTYKPDLVTTVELSYTNRRHIDNSCLIDLKAGIELVNSGKVPNVTKLRVGEDVTAREIQFVCDNMDLTKFTDVELAGLCVDMPMLLTSISDNITHLHSLDIRRCWILDRSAFKNVGRISNIKIDELTCPYWCLEILFNFIKPANIGKLILTDYSRYPSEDIDKLISLVPKVVCPLSDAEKIRDMGTYIVGVIQDINYVKCEDEYESVTVNNPRNEEIDTFVTNVVFDRRLRGDNTSNFSFGGQVGHTITTVGSLREVVYRLFTYRLYSGNCYWEFELVVDFTSGRMTKPIRG